ncbi:hypothetical protein HY468_04735 [Candidatus Roizmanbacteria bacterium]|nr:hypothetical protein [Candidatus Roizmanbacteria bacterium]
MTGTFDVTKNVQNYKTFFLLFVQIALIFGSIRYIFMPNIDQIRTLRNTIVTQELEIQEKQSYLSYLKELASLTLEIEEGVINYALPSENDVITFIVTYEGLGRMENITLMPLSIAPGLIKGEEEQAQTQTQEVTQGKEEERPGLHEFEFEMEATTQEVDSALAFIKELYSARRVFNISELTWVNNEEEDDIALSVMLTTYYFMPPKIKPSAQLVKEGREQGEFIEQLKQTKVYEEVVLDGITGGKQDLFKLEATPPVSTASGRR